MPAARWWDDVRYTCGNILLFRSAEEVPAWPERHGVPTGAILTLRQAWRLAGDWFTGQLDPGWRRLTAEEARASFQAAGLTGEFWRLS